MLAWPQLWMEVSMRHIISLCSLFSPDDSDGDCDLIVLDKVQSEW